jgi:hypothetical protein
MSLCGAHWSEHAGARGSLSTRQPPARRNAAAAPAAPGDPAATEARLVAGDAWSPPRATRAASEAVRDTRRLTRRRPSAGSGNRGRADQTFRNALVFARVSRRFFFAADGSGRFSPVAFVVPSRLPACLHARQRDGQHVAQQSRAPPPPLGVRAEDGHARVGVDLQQSRRARLRVDQEIEPEELEAPAFDRHEPGGAPGFAARRRERVRRDGTYALAKPIRAQIEPARSPGFLARGNRRGRNRATHVFQRRVRRGRRIEFVRV